MSDTSALLLRPTDRVRFKPGKDFDGDARLTYHTWDLAGQFGTRVDTTATGGFSPAVETAILDVLPVNDAPVLNTTPNVSLGSVRPFWQTDPVGVSALLNGAATDVETAQANLGIYVVAATGGTWEYSTDGTRWVTVTKPVYLAPTAQLRFTASPPGSATGTLKYKAWDGTALKPTSASKAVETATVWMEFLSRGGPRAGPTEVPRPRPCHGSCLSTRCRANSSRFRSLPPSVSGGSVPAPWGPEPDPPVIGEKARVPAERVTGRSSRPLSLRRAVRADDAANAPPSKDRSSPWTSDGSVRSRPARDRPSGSPARCASIRCSRRRPRRVRPAPASPSSPAPAPPGTPTRSARP